MDYTIFVSLAFLFGIAAQFSAAGGNDFLRGVIAALEGRLGVMYAVVVVTVVFSPFVLNDVLVLILTPVIVAHAKESGSDVAPLLVGEVTFTNIASSLTPMGNPQNILLWQASGISAGGFVAGTWLPLAVSGVTAAVLLALFASRHSGRGGVKPGTLSWNPALYLGGSAAVVFALDFLGVSSLLSLGAAFALGFAFTFRHPMRVVEELDARSLLILLVLVGAVAAFATLVGPAISPFVSPAAAGRQPYTSEFFGLVSAVIGNVPATQLVLTTAPVTPHAAPILAVGAGLAGNIGPVSSFANLLALVMVRRSGLPIKRVVALQVVIGTIAFLPALL